MHCTGGKPDGCSFTITTPRAPSCFSCFSGVYRALATFFGMASSSHSTDSNPSPSSHRQTTSTTASTGYSRADQMTEGQLAWWRARAGSN